MNYLFHINHPSQYHFFKWIIRDLQEKGHNTTIVARNKDVLLELLDNDGVNYINIQPKKRAGSLLSLFFDFKRQYRIVKRIAKEEQADLLIGTSFVLPWISRSLKIPYINTVEDDASVIPLYAKLSFPLSTYILAPHVCQLGKWERKKLGYNGYHELTYLHPNLFTPNETIAKKYLDLNKKNFLIRFTAFTAHHDYGKKGIAKNQAKELITRLSKEGKVYISSERALPSELQQFELKLNPNDIHHVLAFCDLVVGDSQSMAMEAACLGVPSIRINDYAQRISVLEELEQDYHLTHAYVPNQKSAFTAKINELLTNDSTKSAYQARKNRMLEDKVNVREFLVDFLINYPSSLQNTLFSINANSKRFALRQPNNKLAKRIIGLYLLVLLLLYVFPFKGFIDLNKIDIFSFRGDHVVHLIAFVPLPFFIISITGYKLRYKIFLVLALSFCISAFFELIHAFIPYRAFTVADLSANLIGVLLGVIFVYFVKTLK